VPPRFYLLADVAELLNITTVQARALVTSGELPAIQVGGRGVWRVEVDQLEAYIQRKYEENQARIDSRRRAADRAGSAGSVASSEPEPDVEAN
jgi:excisionase family DNA binding protein